MGHADQPQPPTTTDHHHQPPLTTTTTTITTTATTTTQQTSGDHDYNHRDNASSCRGDDNGVNNGAGHQADNGDIIGWDFEKAQSGQIG